MSFIQKLTTPFKGSEILRTFGRFPISIFCAIAAFIVAGDFFRVADIEYYNWYMASQERVCWVLVNGFFAAGSIRLVAESRKRHGALEYLLSIAVILVVGLFALFHGWGHFSNTISLFFFLSAMAAPFIFREEDDVSFWCYNRDLWGGAAIAFLITLILTGGVQAAFSVTDSLFETYISEAHSKQLWLFGCLVFAPIFALIFVPKKFHYEAEECHAPMVLSFTLNWILAPLAILYFAIFYVYAGKIIMMRQIPDGQLSYMVLGFGGVGTIIYLAGWALREKGTRLLQFLYRHFYKMLVLPTMMMAFAIGIRIDAYALTVDRYLVVLSVIWFTILCAVFAVRPRALKWMPISLMLLLALASFGPWSAVSLSTQSQLARLKTLLVKNEIMVNGAIVPATKPLPFEDEKNISSIIDYLTMLEMDGKVKSFLKMSPSDDLSTNFHGILGVNYIPGYQEERYATESFSSESSTPIGIGGYDFYYSGVFWYENNAEQAEGNDKDIPVVEYRIDGTNFIVTMKEHGALTFDLAGLQEKLRDQKRLNQNPQQSKVKIMPLTLETKNGTLRGRLMITDLVYKEASETEAFAIHNMRFNLLLAL